MTNVEAVISWAAGIAGTGVAAFGGWLWSRINSSWDCITALRKDVDAIYSRIDAMEGCQNKTQIDVMRKVEEAADKSAKHRITTLEDFVRKDDLEDKVIAIMVQNCNSCRKGE